MDEYNITFARSARRELEMLNEKDLGRIFRKIVGLTKVPRPPGCKKLVGSKVLWRIRIGEYRIVYAIYDDKRLVDVVAMRHRKDAYQ